MALEKLNNKETRASFRAKLNRMFLEVYEYIIVTLPNLLTGKADLVNGKLLSSQQPTHDITDHGFMGVALNQQFTPKQVDDLIIAKLKSISQSLQPVLSSVSITSTGGITNGEITEGQTATFEVGGMMSDGVPLIITDITSSNFSVSPSGSVTVNNFGGVSFVAPQVNANTNYTITFTYTYLGVTKVGSITFLVKDTVVVITPAVATLTVSSSSVNSGESVTLTYGITANGETTFSNRYLERRLAGSNAAWQIMNGGVALTNNNGTLDTTPTENSEYRFRFTSESGEKISPVRTVALAIAVSYGWYDVNPYTALFGTNGTDGTDNLAYNGSVTLTSASSSIITDMRAGANKYMVWKVPTSVTDKVKWDDGLWDGTTFTTGLNSGDISPTGTFDFREKIVIGSHEYYVTRNAFAIATETNSRIRLS